MKKYRFGRMGIGTGTKVQQANLRSLAQEMAEDPEMIIPECIGKCSGCKVQKLRSRLRKIQACRNNPDALKRLATKGWHIERAFAAMLTIASENTPIMFANAKLPLGDVSYTVRGNARKEFLIGLEHFDDPKFRLLAYSELAIGKKLHIYSSNDGLQCSGKTPAYPNELIAEVVESSSYSLKKTQNGYRCEHTDHSQGLRIDIISAGLQIEVCKICASAKANILAEITSRILTRKPEEDFDIILGHGVTCTKGTGCTLSGLNIPTGEILDKYRTGKISDRGMIEAYSEKARETLEKANKSVFVLGNTCYECDYETFIAALKPSEAEEKALRRVLKSSPGPVVMDSATPNSVLSIFWEKQGANAIHAITGDKELARSFFLETRDSGKTPVQILREAAVRSRSKEALSRLPEFKKLGKLGKYSDDIARTYRALGRDEALKKVGTMQDDTKTRSINCGFLVALGALKGKEWQYSKEEQDYGKYLADFVKTLLNVLPEGYTEALQNLLTASGSNETAE